MSGEGRTPKYAIRLLVLFVFAAIVFFGGLQLFVPDGSRLTGSYDAASLKYIATQPVSYASSQSCGATSCHDALYKEWSEGAHGTNENKSKCEVCHGPQGEHPAKQAKLVKVRGDGNVVELCLVCHRQMKARGMTGQPQIVPNQHPYPNDGTLNCMQCHNPHSPGLKKAKASTPSDSDTQNAEANTGTSPGESLAANCFGCHGDKGKGGFAPVLAGQSYETLKDKLTKMKSGELNSPTMNAIVSPMKDQDLDAIAKYFAGVS